jgi:hypothetical protein
LEAELAALRASLAREQAMRRQTQAQLSTALDRVSLLERLVPAALEGSAASGAKLGTGPSSVEARAAGLDPESELRAAARRFRLSPREPRLARLASSPVRTTNN